MDLNDLNKKLVISRGAQYYYQDVRLHMNIDSFEKKYIYGKYPKWDVMEDTLRAIYLNYAIEELRKEGKL